MKRFRKVIYTDQWIFGGFKDQTRTFFVIPCIRVVVNRYCGSTSITIGIGILFWEFVFTMEIQK